MQATNSKHMSCQREGEREGEREREREGDGIRGSNQLFIYCLLLVCFSFHCFSFRVISHCEGPHKCAPSHSDCHDLSHGFVNSSQAGTGNNFISQLASFYAYYLWSLSSLHCFSPCPVPITHGISFHCPDQSSQSANRPVDNPPPPHVQKPHRKMVQWVIRVILFLAEKQYSNYELLFAVDEGKSRSSLLFTLQFFSARKTCQISFGSSN